jgi:hypothetical protein
MQSIDSKWKEIKLVTICTKVHLIQTGLSLTFLRFVGTLKMLGKIVDHDLSLQLEQMSQKMDLLPNKHN